MLSEKRVWQLKMDEKETKYWIDYFEALVVKFQEVKVVILAENNPDNLKKIATTCVDVAKKLSKHSGGGLIEMSLYDRIMKLEDTTILKRLILQIVEKLESGTIKILKSLRK